MNKDIIEQISKDLNIHFEVKNNYNNNKIIIRNISIERKDNNNPRVIYNSKF